MRYLAALAVLLLSGCSALGLEELDTGELTGAALRMIGGADARDSEEEIAIGRTAGAQLVGTYGLVDEPALQAYVNRVGLWLAMHTEREDLDWHFAVLDDDGVNAWAAPGGYVFITRGMLALLENEAELAGVLGHEIAHVVRRHHLEAVRSRAGLDTVLQLGRAVYSARAGEEAVLDQDTLERLEGAVGDLYEQGLSREDEFEADRLAMVIAARGGYDPFAYPAVLQRMQGLQREGTALTALTRTHPDTGDRLEALAPALDAPELAASEGALLRERFLAHAAPALGDGE